MSRSATRGSFRPPDVTDPNALTVGQETFSRLLITTASSAPASQSLRLTFFTARKSEVASQVRQWSGTTAAGATPTLARIGLYSVAANGDIALIASTPNDTTLYAAASTAYTKAFSVPVAVNAGVRYAVGLLVVSAAAMPSYYSTSTVLSGVEMSAAPRVSAAVAAQADLPASVVAASLAASASPFYSVILP